MKDYNGVELKEGDKVIVSDSEFDISNGLGLKGIFKCRNTTSQYPYRLEGCPKGGSEQTYQHAKFIGESFKLSDLRLGHILEDENGRMSMVVVGGIHEDYLYYLDSETRDLLSRVYNEDLEWQGVANSGAGRDVVKIYQASRCNPTEASKLVWQKTKKVKEMTVNEVIEELGYDIKIVK